MKSGLSILNSIRTKFAIFYIVFVIVPFSAATLFISQELSRQEIENASRFAINNLKTISINIDEILKNVEFVHTQALTNNEFLTSVKKLNPVEQRQTYKDYDMLININNVLESTSLSNNYIDSIYLYDYNGSTFFSTKGTDYKVVNYPELDAMQWYTRFTGKVSDEKWFITKSYDNTANIISSYREIRDFQNQHPIGLLSVNINERIVTKVFSELRITSSGYSFVIDRNQNMIASDGLVTPESVKPLLGNIPAGISQGYFTIQLNHVKTLAAYYSSDATGFRYVAVAPLNEINTSATLLKSYNIYIYLFMVLIFIAAVFILYAYFYTPINKLFSAMKTLEKGNFAVRLKDRRKDEIGYINRNFNDMVGNLKQLIDENYINKLLKKDAQLKSIQSQINEHFLYNTLDSIHWIARQYKVPQICDIIFSLSRFYRLSLSSGKDVIPIREVADIIRSYIFIQKVRMQEALDFECTVDPEAEDVKVLKYLFQPLVENAVVHGLEKKEGGGKVSVRFTVINRLIEFSVSDNGTGIEPAELGRITTELEKDSEYEEEHFAIRNINSQLKLFYGSEYALKIESIPGSGTRVWFRMPIRPEEEPHVQAVDR